MSNVQHSNLYDAIIVVCIGALKDCSCFFAMVVRGPLAFIDFVVQGPFHSCFLWGRNMDLETDPFLVEVCGYRRGSLRHCLDRVQ